MNLPWWVFRIWRKKNSGTSLPTFGEGPKMKHPGEQHKLEELIQETEQIMPEPASAREAERIVAYAWALYVFADPPVYNLDPDEGKVTKFPLSSFVEVAQGYICTAFDEIEKVQGSRDPAAKAFREVMG